MCFYPPTTLSVLNAYFNAYYDWPVYIHKPVLWVQEVVVKNKPSMGTHEQHFSNQVSLSALIFYKQTCHLHLPSFLTFGNLQFNIYGPLHAVIGRVCISETCRFSQNLSTVGQEENVLKQIDII